MKDKPAETPRERRFFDRVEKGPGYWLWIGGGNNSGYGQLKIKGQSKLANRWFYEQFVGPIESGMTLDHLCRVRCCVNPKHLEPVTRGENVLRGVGISAVHKRKTRCIHGHEFSPENTWWWRGRRICRACNIGRQRSRYRAKSPELRAIEWEKRRDKTNLQKRMKRLGNSL